MGHKSDFHHMPILLLENGNLLQFLYWKHQFLNQQPHTLFLLKSHYIHNLYHPLKIYQKQFLLFPMLVIKKVEKCKTKQELITPLVVNKLINKTSLKVVTYKKHVVMEKPHAVNNSNKYYSKFSLC